MEKKGTWETTQGRVGGSASPILAAQALGPAFGSPESMQRAGRGCGPSTGGGGGGLVEVELGMGNRDRQIATAPHQLARLDNSWVYQENLSQREKQKKIREDTQLQCVVSILLPCTYTPDSTPLPTHKNHNKNQ